VVNCFILVLIQESRRGKGGFFIYIWYKLEKKLDDIRTFVRKAASVKAAFCMKLT